MKQGFSTVNELAQLVDHQRKSKRDFLADTRTLVLDPDAALRVGEMGTFQGNTLFHGQLADKVGIPKRYYDLMREKAPGLLATNVNHWMVTKPEKRFIRTLDGTARAFLSDKYRPIDNWLVLEAALKALSGQDMKVESSEVTDRRMYLKVTFPGLAQEVKVARDRLVAAGVMPRQLMNAPGHVWEELLCPGLVISNSEVGCGRVAVEALVYTFRCTNGAIMSVALSKYHIGKGFDLGDDDARGVFTEQTRQADDWAFLMKLHDVVKSACGPRVFQANLDRVAQAGANIITGDVSKVMERMADRFDLLEGEADSVLNHLVHGGDLSQWGLSSAVTRFSQDVADYERATDLERIGGRIIELPPQEWARMVGAN